MKGGTLTRRKRSATPREIPAARRGPEGGRPSRDQEAEYQRLKSDIIDRRIRGETFESIAAAVGLGSKQAVHALYTRALREIQDDRAETIEAARSFELERLDRIEAAAWARVDNDDPRALDVLIRISDRRARLLGLDAPAKVDLSMDAVDREIARLKAELAEDSHG